jgi:hypothetical protein
MDSKLHDLPGYGKTFVGLFCVLVIGVVLWMSFLGLIHAGIIGYHYDDCPSDNVLQMEAMLAQDDHDDTSIWTDTTTIDQQKKAMTQAEQGRLNNWHRFRDNLEWALEHAGSQVLLYFAVGFLLMMTTYSDKAKKRLYWLGFFVIILHVIGMSGCGFCLPANIMIYTTGPLLLIIFLIISIMILVDLKKK